jgi:hypothetical protein
LEDFDALLSIWNELGCDEGGVLLDRCEDTVLDPGESENENVEKKAAKSHLK